MKSTTNPANIEVRPIKRIWLSLISVNLLNASRHVCGDKNGNIPSRININATALRKFSHIYKQTPVKSGKHPIFYKQQKN